MKKTIFGVALVLGLLASAGSALAADECRASIDGTLTRKEEGQTKTVFTGKVDVSVNETCAVVKFDFVVIEESSGGEQREVRIPKKVKIRDATITSLKLNYELKDGWVVADHRFVQTSCEICE